MGTAAGKGVSSDSQNCADSSVVIPDMSCEACRVRFTVLKRKKNCSECSRTYCGHCAPKTKNGSVRRCERCQFLVSGNFDRSDLQDYKAKELRQFLVKRRVAVDNCREKSDLVDALMQYSNNTQYRLEQQASERRKQELQALARQSLGSPVSQPVPPAYDSLFDRSCDQNNTINIVDDHFSQSSSSSSSSVNNGSRVVNSEQPRVPSRDTSAGQTQSHERSRGETQQREESPDQSSERSQSRDPEVPVTAEISTGASAQGEGQPEENQAQRGAHENSDSQNNSTETETAEHAEQKEKAQSGTQAEGRKKMLLSDVTSEEDIERLTARQLKELLERNFVDYRGCVEKHELVSRVTRLWNEHRRNAQTADQLNSGEEATGSTEVCKICMDALVDCVLLDCGHMLTCTTCGKQLAECPICRQYIVRVVHVFKS